MDSKYFISLQNYSLQVETQLLANIQTNSGSSLQMWCIHGWTPIRDASIPGEISNFFPKSWKEQPILFLNQYQGIIQMILPLYLFHQWTFSVDTLFFHLPEALKTYFAWLFRLRHHLWMLENIFQAAHYICIFPIQCSLFSNDW